MPDTYGTLVHVNPDGSTVTIIDPRVGSGDDTGSGSPGTVVTPSGDTYGATDRAAIQAAINNALSGGIVWLEAGDYYIDGPINLTTGISLRGAGWKTVIHLAPGSNSSMIVAPLTAYWYEIRDLQLDGHKEDQTAGNAAIELLSDTTPNAEMASCGVPLVERVLVRYAWRDGIYSKAVEARHFNCFVFRSGRYNFHADRTDMWYTDCTSGESYDHGFYFSANASECRLSGCKSWWPGYGAPRGAFAWKTAPETLLNANADSFHVVAGADHQQIVNCESQDAARHGFTIGSTKNRVHGMVSRNEGCAVWVTGKSNHVDLACGDPTPIPAGLQATPDALVKIGATLNDIRVRWPHDRALTAGMIGAAVGDNVHTQNRIILGTPDINLTIPWAASITPDPIVGGIQTVMTGNTTINNPALDRMGTGMEFEIVLGQDATGGRTVTFGDRFRNVTPAAPTGTNRWRFRCVGAVWLQVDYSTV